MKFFYMLFLSLAWIEQQTTQLHCASEQEEELAVTSFNTANPFITNYYYDLPWHLRERIADFVGLNTPNKKGWLPLQIAAANGKPKKVLSLLERGANANLHNDAQPTSPLSLAANQNRTVRSPQEKKGCVSISKYLLNFGANPNFINERGQTALHEAIAGHNVATVEALIAAKADLNLKNKRGQTPYEFAYRLQRSLPTRTEEHQSMRTICRMLDQAQLKSSSK